MSEYWDLSPVTWVFLLSSLGTVLWALWTRVSAALGWLGLIAEEGDDQLEPLRTPSKQQRKKGTKGRATATAKAKAKAPAKAKAKAKATVEETPVEAAEPPRRQAGSLSLSLKSLKKASSSSSSKSSVSHHDSPLYVGTLVHGDDVTGCTFSSDTVVTACRDRLLRQFKIPGSSLSSAKRGHTMTAHDSFLVQRGVFDVCCVGNAVVLITRGSAGEPALQARLVGKLDAVSGVHERIFAPKSKFEPLKLVGAGSTVVAASSGPRVAVFHVANDGTLTSSAAPGASFDTSSIVNHDVAMSPDGNGRFAVATFSADVPIFSVDERAKLRKVSSCVGAKKKVKCVAWSGCGGYIAASSEDMMLRVFEVRAEAKARYEAVVSSGVPATATLDSLAWVGDRVVGASGTDIFVFDGKSLDVLDVVRGAHNASPIRLAADHHQGNSKFVVSWNSNSARLWKVGL